jgi:DNA polymerase-1
MGKIRKIFRARPDHVLLFLDYDQIEIKLAAHFSGQEYMLDAIRDGKDLHGLSAEKYYGTTPKDATFKLMRSVAKRQNYAMLYGCQAYRLHVTLIEEAGIRIPIPICEQYVNAYWDANDKILDLKEKLEKEVERTQGVRNPYGRYVTIPVGFEYIVINALIQSTAGDIIKAKMLDCQDILDGSNSHMILMVHDELIFEIHREDLHLITPLKRAMEELDKFSIPITCSMKWGKNWLDKRAVKLKEAQ